MQKLIVFLPLLSAVAGCDDGIPTRGCDPDDEAPAISLTVLDAPTRGPIPEEGQARVTAEGRRAIADVSANDSTPLTFLDDRPGTYDVLVEADGYRTWDTTGVQVAYEGCVVETPVLRALIGAGVALICAPCSPRRRGRLSP